MALHRGLSTNAAWETQSYAAASREVARVPRATWPRFRFAAKFAPVTAISRRKRMG